MFFYKFDKFDKKIFFEFKNNNNFLNYYLFVKSK